jgi:dihydrofolate reductase
MYIGIAAITLDGKIGRNAKHFSSWTSKEDKKFMRALLNTSDVIIVGNSTYKTAIKPLSKRNCIVLTRTVKSVHKKRDNLVYLNPRGTNLKQYVAESAYKTVAVLGGAQTYSYCLKMRLLDELYLTIEPVIFGAGVPLFSEIISSLKVTVVSVKKLNRAGTVLIHAVLR